LSFGQAQFGLRQFLAPSVLHGKSFDRDIQQRLNARGGNLPHDVGGHTRPDRRTDGRPITIAGKHHDRPCTMLAGNTHFLESVAIGVVGVDEHNVGFQLCDTRGQTGARTHFGDYRYPRIVEPVPQRGHTRIAIIDQHYFKHWLFSPSSAVMQYVCHVGSLQEDTRA
jgi:hypothetical protein